MHTIKKITSETQKYEISLLIMNALPEWFSPPEDIAFKARVHEKYVFYAVFDEDNPIGFAAIKEHNQYTAEIYNFGVLKEYHHMGIGKMLINECTAFCHDTKRKFLTVKTLDSSAVYEPYNGTRTFYKKMCFYPLEVLTNFWDAENPCLFLVKSIDE